MIWAGGSSACCEHTRLCPARRPLVLAGSALAEAAGQARCCTCCALARGAERLGLPASPTAAGRGTHLVVQQAAGMRDSPPIEYSWRAGSAAAVVTTVVVGSGLQQPQQPRLVTQADTQYRPQYGLVSRGRGGASGAEWSERHPLYQCLRGACSTAHLGPCTARMCACISAAAPAAARRVHPERHTLLFPPLVWQRPLGRPHPLALPVHRAPLLNNNAYSEPQNLSINQQSIVRMVLPSPHLVLLPPLCFSSRRIVSVPPSSCPSSSCPHGHYTWTMLPSFFSFFPFCVRTAPRHLRRVPQLPLSSFAFGGQPHPRHPCAVLVLTWRSPPFLTPPVGPSFLCPPIYVS